MRTAIVTIFVILGMVGAFFVGNYLSSPPTDLNGISAPEILEEARKQVPPPQLPPKPAGQTVTTIEHRTVQVPTPQVTFGNGLIRIPQVSTVMKDVTTDVPVTKLVDASQEQIAAWDAQVKQLQAQYEREIQAKAQEIAKQKQDEKLSHLMDSTKEVVKDLIIPLITALTGLIGALAALRWGTKPPATNSES